MKHDLTTTEAGRKKLKAAEEALTTQALTTHQLAEAIHISPVHSYRYVSILRGERPEISPRRIYIADWPKVGAERQRCVAAYRWMVTGKEKDKPKPKPLTPQQRTALQVKRCRQDPLLNARVNARRRLRYAIKNNLNMHPLPASFFTSNSDC